MTGLPSRRARWWREKDRTPLGIGDLQTYGTGVLTLRSKVDLGLTLGSRGIDPLRVEQHAVRPEIERRDGRAVGHDEFGLAVNAAVEIHVGRGRQDIVALAVGNHDQQRVVGPEADIIGDLEGEGRRSAAVRAGMAPVHEQVGHGLHAVELHEKPFVGPVLRQVDIVLVVSGRLEPEALGRGIGIPAVGQGDVPGIVARILRLEEETPPLVERENLAGLYRKGRDCQEQRRYVSFHGVRFLGDHHRQR